MLDSLDRPSLINTPLQRGARTGVTELNRFSGFLCMVEALKTAKAVEWVQSVCFTPLKRGVNERGSAQGI
jgi:hypothetical protein